MKKSILLAAVALSGMSLVSCDHFLDENRYPMSIQTNNPAYWDNEANVQKQCNNMYTNFTGFATGTGGLFYFQTLTDDQASGIGGDFTTWKYTGMVNSSSLWNDPYIQIRHANEIIEKVSASSLMDNVKAKYIGIARLQRAQQYYWLVRTYGDVPYIDEVVNDLDINNALLQAPRTNRDEVMDHVYDDLKYAAENIGSGSKTTYSSDLAYAMMSQICLYEASYCKYRTLEENYYAPDEARAKKYYEYVVAAGDYLMGRGYSLNADYQANYNSVSLESNPEMIFYKEYKEATLTHQTIQYNVLTTTIAGISKDAFDAFLFTDGKPLATTTCDTNDAGELTTGIVDGGSEVGDILSLEKVLAVRDKRLSATIDPVVCFGTTQEGMTWSRAGSSQLSSSSGYTIRKYDNTSLPLNYRTQSNYTCAPVYWLAVVYLEYAEAKAELGTLTDSDLDKTINKLYTRAGLPTQTVAGLSSMNDPANNMGVSSLLWEIRRCRRCETMMDNNLRYWDLQRWHQLELLDTSKHPNIKLGANLKNAVRKSDNMVGDYIQATPNNDRIYEARQYLGPIPTGQISLNSHLEQNALWK